MKDICYVLKNNLIRKITVHVQQFLTRHLHEWLTGQVTISESQQCIHPLELYWNKDTKYLFQHTFLTLNLKSYKQLINYLKNINYYDTNGKIYKQTLKHYIQNENDLFPMTLLEVGFCLLKLLQFSQDFWFTKNLDQISNIIQVVHCQPVDKNKNMQILI